MTAGIDEACGEKRGTRAGYQRHYNASQPACEPCLKANTSYGAVYRSNRKKAVIEPAPPPRMPEVAINAEVTVPITVLGALLFTAPTEVEEWAEDALGADLVTQAIAVAEVTVRRMNTTAPVQQIPRKPAPPTWAARRFDQPLSTRGVA